MSARHHPSDDTLLAFAAGTLDHAHRIVVAAHLESCPQCRARVLECEAAGGELLADIVPAPLSADALAHMMARLDVTPEREAAARADLEPGMPEALRGLGMGRWITIGWGLQFRAVRLPEGARASLFMLKGQPGTRLPAHSHTGMELTAILKGAYADEDGRFGAGDFEEADSDVAHRPVVQMEGECVCLVALEGRLQLAGLAGKILNPFLRL